MFLPMLLPLKRVYMGAMKLVEPFFPLLERLLVIALCALLSYIGLTFLTLMLRRAAPEAELLVMQLEAYKLQLALFLGLALSLLVLR